MKVALVHDYLTRFGGAERVLAALAEVWSQAPIFTSVVDKSINHQLSTINYSSIRPSALQRLPFKKKLSKLFVPTLPLVFEGFDLSEFDVVISLGYFAKGVLTTPEQLHINYCHTPPRFLYGYPTEARVRESRLGALLTSPIDHKLRVWDFYSAQRPDYIVANSQTVAARIKKFWARDAQIIYPPVALPPRESGKRSINNQLAAVNYFLVVSRLEPYKNVDLAVRACNQLRLPLKVVGEGSERRRLEKLVGRSATTSGVGPGKVALLGRVSDEKLAELYAGCRALIFPVQDEDFGIVPVEAMDFGKPVIALRSGGVTETVVENETGLFFDEPTVESLMEAICNFNDVSYLHTEECQERCRSQAEKFSKKRFQQEFQEFVEGKWQSRG